MRRLTSARRAVLRSQHIGFASALVGFRPIAFEDIELLRRWRNSDRVRLRMFSPHIISMENQAAWWLARVADSTYRQYLLSYAGQPLASISFSSLNVIARSAECGYYVGAQPAPPRTGTLLLFAGLQEAFDVLGFDTVVCRVFADNRASVRVCRRVGFLEEAGPAGHLAHGRVGLYALTAQRFGSIKPELETLLFGTRSDRATA